MCCHGASLRVFCGHSRAWCRGWKVIWLPFSRRNLQLMPLFCAVQITCHCDLLFSTNDWAQRFVFCSGFPSHSPTHTRNSQILRTPTFEQKKLGFLSIYTAKSTHLFLPYFQHWKFDKKKVSCYTCTVQPLQQEAHSSMFIAAGTVHGLIPQGWMEFPAWKVFFGQTGTQGLKKRFIFENIYLDLCLSVDWQTFFYHWELHNKRRTTTCRLFINERAQNKPLELTAIVFFSDKSFHAGLMQTLLVESRGERYSRRRNEIHN